MKWSWRIATVSGIGIYLHGTFLLLLAYVVLAELSGGGNVRSIRRSPADSMRMGPHPAGASQTAPGPNGTPLKRPAPSTAISSSKRDAPGR